MKFPTLFAAVTVAAFGLATTALTHAAPKAEIDRQVTATLAAFDALNPANETLVGKAAGILVFPDITKAGAGIAGEYGEGVLQVGGQTVNYYSVASGSVGLTLGLSKHSEVIMFMTKEALDTFVASEGWSIGADAEILVVTAGAHGEYDSMTEQKPILVFAFAEKGLLGDLSLVGTKISPLEQP